VNLGQLRELVAPGESERLEFKRSTGSLRDGMKTICALLNSRLGGFVLFGVNDAGGLVGQDVSTGTMEDIANALSKIEPPAFPDTETVIVENGKSVVVARVPGGNGLYTYDGRAYQRVGPTTQVMPRQRYERLLLERMHGTSRWENQPAHGLGIRDLDHTEITRTLEEGIRRQRLEDPGNRDPVDFLERLGVMHNGQLLNAAIVLSGRADRLMPHYPQCLLRMARFRGREKNEFIDNRQEVGNAFDLFIRAQRFLRDHLPVAGRVLPNLFERVDDPLYPPEALR
jgi:ATP-dependent DNA helicase RecG